MARIKTKRRGDRKDQTNLHIDRQDNPHNVTAEQLGLEGDENLSVHVNDESNPHNVTASQTGAAEEVHTHTESEITDLSHYTNEEARDAIAQALQGGTDIQITHDDANDTITIAYVGADNTSQLQAYAWFMS